MFSRIKMFTTDNEKKKYIAINDGKTQLWKLYAVQGDNYRFFACSLPKSSNPSFEKLMQHKL
jgi:hypothetical protein